MTHTYKTIDQASQGEFKDRGSKFIGYAFPIKTEEEAKEHLQQLRKEHPKARHVCYALSIGYKEPLQRDNDDGEPSNSAGKPIMGQILSHELTNILVAVVRYFGGSLLGVPGLINAYKTAAAEALKHAAIIENKVQAIYEIRADYSSFHELMNFLKQENVVFLKQELQLDCYLMVSIDLDKRSLLEQKLTDHTGLRWTFIKHE